MYFVISYPGPGNQQQREIFPDFQTALKALLQKPDSHDAYVWTPECRAVEKKDARHELNRLTR